MLVALTEFQYICIEYESITAHFYLRAKLSKSVDHKYEVGGTGVVHFLGIFC